MSLVDTLLDEVWELERGMNREAPSVQKVREVRVNPADFHLLAKEGTDRGLLEVTRDLHNFTTFKLCGIVIRSSYEEEKWRLITY